MVGTGDLASETLSSKGNQSSLLGRDKQGNQSFSPQTTPSTLLPYPLVPQDGEGHTRTETISLECVSFGAFLLLYWPKQEAMCIDDGTGSTWPDTGRIPSKWQPLPGGWSLRDVDVLLACQFPHPGAFPCPGIPGHPLPSAQHPPRVAVWGTCPRPWCDGRPGAQRCHRLAEPALPVGGA